ncbi:hypothetical protein ABKN59_005485 [Abortiporus biennis]
MVILLFHLSDNRNEDNVTIQFPSATERRNPFVLVVSVLSGNEATRWPISDTSKYIFITAALGRLNSQQPISPRPAL